MSNQKALHYKAAAAETSPLKKVNLVSKFNSLSSQDKKPFENNKMLSDKGYIYSCSCWTVSIFEAKGVSRV